MGGRRVGQRKCPGDLQLDEAGLSCHNLVSDHFVVTQEVVVGAASVQPLCIHHQHCEITPPTGASVSTEC